MSKKIRLGIIITIICLCIGFLTWCFLNCINLYDSFDVKYSELKKQELTFEKYKIIHQGKGGNLYEIYFKEYDEPFEISKITQKALNKDALVELKQNTLIEVYYRESDYKKYAYEICEMKANSVEILSLSDYKNVNQNNQIIGMIVCPIMILCLVFLIGIAFISVKNSKICENINEEDIELDDEITDYGSVEDNEDLGKIRIEYEENGNVIQIYNSPHVCSLVINNRIVDRYLGLVFEPFCLKGEIAKDDKKVLVEAKMGYFIMRLYYNGNLVKKRFMAFG